MSLNTCESCLKNPSNFTCGICTACVCKKCVQFISEDTFEYSTSKPEIAQHDAYCATCFDAHVAPEVQKYETVLQNARNVRLLYKGNGKAVRALFIKKQEAPISLKHCADREELILRLAFMAAEKNFNMLVDTEIKYEKVRNAAYVKHVWNGTAIPAHAEESRFQRNDIDQKFGHLLPY